MYYICTDVPVSNIAIVLERTSQTFLDIKRGVKKCCENPIIIKLNAPPMNTTDVEELKSLSKFKKNFFKAVHSS